MEPSVSVVIPTFNRASLVGRAVESALRALLPGDEVVVVDDGSTDDTLARLARFGTRIRLVPGAHGGPGAARNLGIRQVRTPLVAFLDSDDEWMPDKIQLQRRVMERHPEVLFCFSDLAHRRRDGREVRQYLKTWHNDPRPWSELLGPGAPFSSLGPLPAERPDFDVHVGDLYATEMRGDYVCTSTLMVRKEAAGDSLRFAEDLLRFEDWECVGRLARRGKAAYLDCETQWNLAHAGPRLTAVSELYSETARITVLGRVWGADAVFLQAHGETYGRLLDEHRRARARALIALGRTPEAREELRQVASARLRERLLAALPGHAAHALVRARRRLGELRAGPHLGRPKGTVAGARHLLGRVVHGVARRLPRRIAHIESVDIMRARTSDLRFMARVPRAFTVRPSEPEDWPLLAKIIDPRKLDRFASEGDRCLLAVSEGAVHAMEWARLGPGAYHHDRGRLGVSFLLPEGACWLHNGLKAAQGATGSWALIMGRLKPYLESHGVDTIYLQVDATNRHSRDSHLSLGFQAAGRLVAVGILGMRVVGFRQGAGRWARVRDSSFDLARLPPG